VVCSLIIMISYLGWVSAQVTALGLVFHLLSGASISIAMGMTIGLLSVLAYTLLAEISLGMVLMRLFQTSRRFQVEIQPQLVLLQKTLLNIEGLGRQLDPNLDLWSTAKPFLEKWMLEQMGPQRLWRELQAEAPRYAKLIPEMPRLFYSYLKQDRAGELQAMRELITEQKRTNRLLQTIIYCGVGFVLGLVVVRVLQLGYFAF